MAKVTGAAVVLAASLVAMVPLASSAQFNNLSNGPLMSGAVGSFPDDTPKGSLFGSKSAQASPAPSAGSGGGGGGGGMPAPNESTVDEKRMQKKYKANMSHMKDIIAKGESMMKSAPNQDDKAYKKGKVLKEIGEKQLAEMQANSPFPADTSDDKKKN